MAATGTGGRGAFWGQLTNAVAQGVSQHLSQKQGGTPQAAAASAGGGSPPNGGSRNYPLVPILNSALAKLERGSGQLESGKPLQGEVLPAMKGGDCCNQLLSVLNRINANILKMLECVCRPVGAGGPPKEEEEKKPKKKKSWWERVWPGLEEIGLGMEDPRPLRGLGRTLGGIGTVAGETIPGPVGKGTRLFFRFYEILAKSADRLKLWTDRLHEGNIRFAEFSGSMKAVALEQQARDIRLSQQRGENLAESARYLAEGKSRLERVLADIEDPFIKLQNRIGGFLANLVGALGEKVGLGGPAGPAGQPLAGWMAQTAQEGWHQYYGRPRDLDFSSDYSRLQQK